MEKTDFSPAASALLSRFQAQELLHARASGLTSFKASLDLGFSRQQVRLEPAGIDTNDRTLLAWPLLQAIADSENKCFRVLNGRCEEIRFYSQSSRRVFSLWATAEAPALMISGFTMHRVRGISPRRAAQAMVDAAGPIHGRVLDTATGLGYTAIAAAQKASSVITVELEAGTLEMARLNPWSQELFHHPAIRLIAGDSSEEIARFADGHFSVIIHDPPSMSLAGDLYGAEFYRQAWRVLAAGGRMFHYLGDPASDAGGRIMPGVMKRLRAAGFRRLTPKTFAHGVLACK